MITFSFLNSFEMVKLDIQVTCPCFTLGTFAMLKCLCIVLIECTMNLGLGVNKVYVLISCCLRKCGVLLLLGYGTISVCINAWNRLTYPIVDLVMVKVIFACFSASL
jgi:hypothetical protein